MNWSETFRYLVRQLRRPETSNSLANPTLDGQVRRKLGRNDVLALIDQHGGSEGLDLSEYDLSGADLSRLDLHGALFSKHDSDGNLRKSANLTGVRCTDTNLMRADLTHVNLEGASFWQANLYEATLHASNASLASFGKANLEKADLYGCNLAGANLWYANLKEANLGVARIADAVMTGVQFGDKILHEDQKAYEAYFQRWYAAELPTRYAIYHLERRWLEAAEIYMNLKNAFLSHGRYREASWAYLKERRLRHKTFAPWRARVYYGEEVQNQSVLSLGKFWFYIKYTMKWVLDWIADITCGYGETPFRTLAWALVILLLFPILYRFSGGITGVQSWLDYFNYSLGAFTTIGFESFQAETPVAQTLTSLEALLGISILALLMFTLGNRVNRG